MLLTVDSGLIKKNSKCIVGSNLFERGVKYSILGCSLPRRSNEFEPTFLQKNIVYIAKIKV